MFVRRPGWSFISLIGVEMVQMFSMVNKNTLDSFQVGGMPMHRCRD